MAQHTCHAPTCVATRQRGHLYCPTHVSRLKRLGTFDPPPQATPISTSGYRLRGRQYEHRVVLLAVIGEAPHPCHWCNRILTWGVDLHVDHLDSDKLNNDPHNLVPSCHPCNTRRASYGRALKTHCKHNHEYTPDNTGYDKGGARVCRTCSRIGERRRSGKPESAYARPVDVSPEEWRENRLKEYLDLGGGWSAVAELVVRWAKKESSVVTYLRTAGITLPDRRHLRRMPPAPPKVRPTVAERIAARVEKAGDCELWPGARTPSGHGQIKIGKKVDLVHRVAYRLHVGQIPGGWNVRQTCGTPSCVFVPHLYVESPAATGLSMRSERCGRGHKMEGDNVYLRPDNGAPVCQACSRERERARRAA